MACIINMLLNLQDLGIKFLYRLYRHLYLYTCLVIHYISYAFIPSMYIIKKLKYVTVRVKASLVHTSDFVWLMTYKIFLECYIKLKFSAMIK